MKKVLFFLVFALTISTQFSSQVKGMKQITNHQIQEKKTGQPNNPQQQLNLLDLPDEILLQIINKTIQNNPTIKEKHKNLHSLYNTCKRMRCLSLDPMITKQIIALPSQATGNTLQILKKILFLRLSREASRKLKQATNLLSILGKMMIAPCLIALSDILFSNFQDYLKHNWTFQRKHPDLYRMLKNENSTFAVLTIPLLVSTIYYLLETKKQWRRGHKKESLLFTIYSCFWIYCLSDLLFFCIKYH